MSGILRDLWRDPAFRDEAHTLGILLAVMAAVTLVGLAWRWLA